MPLKANSPLLIPLAADQRLAFERERNDTDVMKHWRMQLDLSGVDAVHVRLTQLEAFHLGGLRPSSLNCAAMTVLLDCAVAISGMLQFPGERSATVDLSIKLMRPAFSRVWVTGAAWRKTDQLVFTGAELFENDRLCASATGIVAVSRDSRSGLERGHGSSPGVE
jgi:acyl-coenzyme A thioesterase PaaI-like protein